VFTGTPPPKPLNCKSWSNRSGALISNLRAGPTGEEQGFLCAIFRLVRSDIINMSFGSASRSFAFRWGLCLLLQGNKKPCLHGVGRVWKSNLDSLPACVRMIQVHVEGLSPVGLVGFGVKHTARAQPATANAGGLRTRHGQLADDCYVPVAIHRTWKTCNTHARLRSTYTLGGALILNLYIVMGECQAVPLKGSIGPHV